MDEWIVNDGPEDRCFGCGQRLLRVEGRDYHLEGELVDERGEVLTRASARWRRLGA